MGTLAGAIWQTNGWVVVVSACVSGRTVTIIAGFWVHTVRLFTHKPVRRAVELVVTRW